MVPVSPVLDLDRVIVATDGNTMKVRNIRENPSVAFSADEYDEDWERLRGVVVFGEATVIDAGFEWERDRDLLYGKYPQYPRASPDHGRCHGDGRRPDRPRRDLGLLRGSRARTARLYGLQRYRSKKSRISCMWLTCCSMEFAWWPLA